MLAQGVRAMGRKKGMDDETRITIDPSEYHGGTILILVERPSFGGTLTVRFVEQRVADRLQYALHCTKTAPLDDEEFRARYYWGLANHLGLAADWLSLGERVAAERYFQTPLEWLREVPSEEAAFLIRSSRDDTITHLGEERWGLDGSEFQLIIPRARQWLELEWWHDPPAENAVLSRVVTTLLKRADVESARRESIAGTERARFMSSLSQSVSEKLEPLQEEADREKEIEDRERKITLDRVNEETHRIAALLENQAMACPHCGRQSQEMRYLDNRPGVRSFFICPHCGRSFDAGDLMP